MSQIKTNPADAGSPRRGCFECGGGRRFCLSAGFELLRLLPGLFLRCFAILRLALQSERCRCY
mgnify:CR=1 FL=1